MLNCITADTADLPQIGFLYRLWYSLSKWYTGCWMSFCIGFKIDTLSHPNLQNRYSVVRIMLYFNMLYCIAADTAAHFATYAVSLLIQSILMIYILLDMVLYRFWIWYARARVENIASMQTSTSERENGELVMLFSPQAHNPLGAGSRGVVGLLPRGCEQAHLGCWAGPFGVLSRRVWNVELVRFKCWVCQLGIS